MRGVASAVQHAPEARTINEWDVPWDRSVLGSGTGINEITAFNLSAVWACQTLIADAIATLPADTYRKSNITIEGRERSIREPTTPPSWIEQPNPEMTRVDYDTQRIISLTGWGNAYSLLVRQGGAVDSRAPVVQRWVVDPWRCRPFRDPKTGSLYYDVNGKTYLPSQVQHIRGYVRPGELCGMSCIENARRSLGLGARAEEFGEKFYQNGVTSNVVLEMPQMPADVQDEVIEKTRDMVASRYAGSGNAFRPLVLFGGTQAKPLSINPNDAQYLETRKFQVEEIARWFRVPPHMIGDIDRSTSWGSGIEQQTLGFAKFTLMPWIRRLEIADSMLLTRPQFLKLNLDSFVRADLLTRYRAYALGRAGGWLAANDILEYEDMPPVAGGEVLLAPLNMADLQLFDNGDVPAQAPGGGANPGVNP